MGKRFSFGHSEVDIPESRFGGCSLRLLDDEQTSSRWQRGHRKLIGIHLRSILSAQRAIGHAPQKGQDGKGFAGVIIRLGLARQMRGPAPHTAGVPRTKPARPITTISRRSSRRTPR